MTEKELKMFKKHKNTPPTKKTPEKLMTTSDINKPLQDRKHMDEIWDFLFFKMYFK